MITRFLTYNKELIYIGDLDRDKLYSKLAEYIKHLPDYVTTLNTTISNYDVDANNILVINLLFYVPKDILSDESLENMKHRFIHDLNELLTEGLKEQKVLFSL